MKITLTPFGSRGDVYPLAYLGMKLVQRGHSVRMCATPENRTFLEGQGFECIYIGSDFKEIVNRLSSFMGKPFQLISPSLKLLREELHLQFEQLAEVLPDSDLIIGSGIQFLSKTIAQYHHIPYRHIFHVPVIIPSAYHAPYIFPWYNLPRWLNRSLWSIYAAMTDVLLMKTINTFRTLYKLKPASLSTYVDFGEFILAVTPELAKPAPDTTVLLQADYLFPQQSGTISPDLQKFLDDGEPPVYVGFGSMGDAHPEKTINTVFDVVQSLNIRAIISKGWAEYTSLKKSDRIFYADNEPHLLLFPKTRVVIHHGGAGTTSSAAACGVPQIIVPNVLDQYFWGHRIEELNIGIMVPSKKKFDTRNLVPVLKSLFNNPSIEQSAKELGRKLTGRNGVDQIADNLERIIAG